MLVLCLVAAACSSGGDGGASSGRTKNAALPVPLALVNGTFTAGAGGWVGSGYTLGDGCFGAGVSTPSLGKWAPNSLTFSFTSQAVTQKVVVAAPGLVTFSVTVYDGGMASPFQVLLQDSNETATAGQAATGWAFTPAKAVSVSVTTTVVNEPVTITLSGVSANYWGNCYGVQMTNASLVSTATAIATAATVSATTAPAAPLVLVNGTFTAGAGGWVGTGYTLGDGCAAAGVSTPSLGKWAPNSLTFSFTSQAVTQKVVVPSPGLVTFSVTVFDGSMASPFQVVLQDSNETATKGQTTPSGYATPKVVSVSVTTTVINEPVTITLSGVSANYWGNCYGVQMTNALLVSGANTTIPTTTIPATTTIPTTTILTPTVSSSTSTTTTTKPTATTAPVVYTAKVGDVGPSGGPVFFVDMTAPVGSQYMEAAPSNWSGGLSEPALSWVAAIAAANAYRGSGATTWHLPTKDELNKLCLYARNVTTGTICSAAAGTMRAGFPSGVYWSSTDSSVAANAWAMLFSVGLSSGTSKLGALGVRPVRFFIPAATPVTTTSTSTSSTTSTSTTTIVKPVVTTTTIAAPPTCAMGGLCNVGDIGPSGGSIVSANPFAAAGSRYVESAPLSFQRSYPSAGFVPSFGVPADYATAVSNLAAYSVNGRTGWRLPTKLELQQWEGAGLSGWPGTLADGKAYWSTDVFVSNRVAYNCYASVSINYIHYDVDLVNYWGFRTF
ncbi:unannotated protein [freshwater metagenome]|uniref:Unannotated protein n=3 Tax=freshwater metagenome TaxID=449393 RepID=A0A6J7QNK9_9ZZZZ